MDIISGDKVLEFCDLIITNSQIKQFHKGVEHFIFKMVDINYITDEFITSINNCSRTLKIFVYTHLLDDFIQKLLPYIKVKFILFCHNSDEEFNMRYSTLINHDLIEAIHAQNLNIVSSKCHLLPIGIANKMWPHGNLFTLNAVMKIIETNPLHTKTHKLYINFNVNTHPYRKEVMKYCLDNGYEIQPNKKFYDYLYNLKDFEYALCVRGNGIDTHRFWECVYLGVIPIIINNEKTNMDNFVVNLRKLGIKFVEIKDLSELKQYK